MYISQSYMYILFFPSTVDDVKSCFFLCWFFYFWLMVFVTTTVGDPRILPMGVRYEKKSSHAPYSWPRLLFSRWCAPSTIHIYTSVSHAKMYV